MINESLFFQEILGFPESIDSVQNFLQITNKDPDNLILESVINDRQFRIGKFQIISVGNLYTNFFKYGNQQNSSGAIKQGRFHMVIGRGNWTEDVQLVDVGALQANPENRGATFQVASNFNCLEFIDANDNAKKGVSKYIYDLTQGPAASISALPGTIYRNYFVPHQQDGRKYIGQLDEQINLLDKFPYLTMQNGYISFSDEEVAYLKSMNINYDDLSDIQVGTQKKCSSHKWFKAKW